MFRNPGNQHEAAAAAQTAVHRLPNLGLARLLASSFDPLMIMPLTIAALWSLLLNNGALERMQRRRPSESRGSMGEFYMGEF
jgi:predicted Na+-dependent transporter